MGFPKFNQATPEVGRSDLEMIARERAKLLAKIKALRRKPNALKDRLDCETTREQEWRERRKLLRNELIFIEKMCGGTNKSIAAHFGIGEQAVEYAWDNRAQGR
jgi:hypothetical protein